jgi:hypothetical protein
MGAAKRSPELNDALLDVKGVRPDEEGALQSADAVVASQSRVDLDVVGEDCAAILELQIG